jgi:hypothetical protein
MEVVLQVSTDTEEIETNLNSDPLKFGFWTDSGKHQQLRRTQSACGNDDLTRRAGLFYGSEAEIFDPHGTYSAEKQLRCIGMGQDCQVRARARWAKICIRRTTAGAVRERGLKWTAAFLKLSVEIGVEWNPHFLRRGKIAFDERV